MAQIGETPSEMEVREAWIAHMLWAFEPKSNDEVALGKTAEELAGEAFDRMIRDRIATAFQKLFDGLELVTSRR